MHVGLPNRRTGIVTQAWLQAVEVLMEAHARGKGEGWDRYPATAPSFQIGRRGEAADC